MAEGISNHTVQRWTTLSPIKPELYFEPDNERQVVEIIKKAAADGKSLRVVGRAHSFNEMLMDSEEYVICLKRMNKVLSVDNSTKVAVIQAGASLMHACDQLWDYGLSMIQLPMVTDGTIGGVLGTATHGTGITHGCLGTYVKSVRVALANGEIKEFSKEDDEDIFRALLCSFGTLGIILTVEWQCTDAFKIKLKQVIMAEEKLVNNFETYIKECEYFMFFGFPGTGYGQALFQDRTTERETVFTVVDKLKVVIFEKYVLEFLCLIASFFPHLLSYVSRFMLWYHGEKEIVGRNYRIQLLNFPITTGYCSEHFFSIKHFKNYCRDMFDGFNKEAVYEDAPLLIRFVKADNFYLSPTTSDDKEEIFVARNHLRWFPYGRKPNDVSYITMEAKLSKKYEARPHWGKVLQDLHDGDYFKKAYPQFGEFLRIREKLDPSCLFVNKTVRKLLGLY